MKYNKNKKLEEKNCFRLKLNYRKREKECNIRWKSNSFVLALINFEINTLNTSFYCVERIGGKQTRWRTCGQDFITEEVGKIRLSIMEFILYANRITKKTNVTFCLNKFDKQRYYKRLYAWKFPCILFKSISFYLKVLVCECKVLGFSTNCHLKNKFQLKSYILTC